VARENEASSEKATRSSHNSQIDVFQASGPEHDPQERGEQARRFGDLTLGSLRVSVLGIRESTRASRGFVFRETASFVPPPARDASGYSRRDALRRDGVGRAAIRSEAHRTI
jgi:hypothetical protein